MNFSFTSKYGMMLLNGAEITLILAFFTVIFGTLLGMVIALGRLSRLRPLRIVSTAYVEFIRGTPLMVQILMIFYGLAMIGIRMPEAPWLSKDFPRIMAGIISLSINSAAYVAEIIRSGIQAVDVGQMEAARSLGMRQSLAMTKIILPQAVRNILPALGNEFVVVIKESSMVSLIGAAELMFMTNTIIGATFLQFEPLIICAIVYFIMTFTTSKLLGILERRMRRSD